MFVFDKEKAPHHSFATMGAMNIINSVAYIEENKSYSMRKKGLHGKLMMRKTVFNLQKYI